MIAQLILGLAVVGLVLVVLSAGTGQLGRVVAGFGGAFAGLVDQVGTSPSPTSAVTAAPIDPPVLEPPAESYTNQPAVDLSGSLPAGIAGNDEYRLRVYLNPKNQSPSVVTEISVGATPSFTIPGVPLVKGANEFTVTIVGPAGESHPSGIARYVYDTSLPKVTITSPQDGTTVNAATVTIAGKTQGRSKLVARNEANGAMAPGQAATDGSFSLTIPIATGPNGITITATDPAGNVGTTVLSVLRGSGKLEVSLKASNYRFSLAKLPQPLTLTAVVTDPDGHPLEGAQVTVSVTIPGLAALVQDTVTDGTGTATFDTTVPTGATIGTGTISVFVTTTDFGTTSARAVIAVAK